MTQRSLFWDGQVLGDCGPYTQTHVQDQFFRCVLNGTGNRGVVRGWRSELLVSGSSSPVSVAAGGAVVYGMLFESDAATTVNIPTPSTGNARYDRIVVQRAWGTQVVRVARVAGVAAPAPAIPALTQAAGAFWEIPLATVYVTDAGAITLTDTREFCTFPTAWPANIVTAGMFEQGAVTAGKRPDRFRWDGKGAGAFRPNSANPCTWTAGATYNYWAFADAAFNRGWAFFGGDASIVGAVASFYVWSVPDVNGAGGGVENCQWDYSIYYSNVAGAPTNVAASVNVDQQLRVNTTAYRDLLVAGVTVGDGTLVAVQLSRDGAADSYNSAMRFLAVEMYWSADS